MRSVSIVTIGSEYVFHFIASIGIDEPEQSNSGNSKEFAQPAYMGRGWLISSGQYQIDFIGESSLYDLQSLKSTGGNNHFLRRPPRADLEFPMTTFCQTDHRHVWHPFVVAQPICRGGGINANQS